MCCKSGEVRGERRQFRLWEDTAKTSNSVSVFVLFVVKMFNLHIWRYSRGLEPKFSAQYFNVFCFGLHPKVHFIELVGTKILDPELVNIVSCQQYSFKLAGVISTLSNWLLCLK